MLYQLSHVRIALSMVSPEGLREPRRGRYWDRTSDLFRVKEARYRCANRPQVLALSMPALSGGPPEYYTLLGVTRASRGVSYAPSAVDSARGC